MGAIYRPEVYAITSAGGSRRRNDLQVQPTPFACDRTFGQPLISCRSNTSSSVRFGGGERDHGLLGDLEFRADIEDIAASRVSRSLSRRSLPRGAVNGVHKFLTVNGLSAVGNSLKVQPENVKSFGVTIGTGTPIADRQRPILIASKILATALVDSGDDDSKIPTDFHVSSSEKINSMPVRCSLMTDSGTTAETVQTGLGILKSLEGKHILITGATGFLAKVLVEKILRVQPDVAQLYLVIQPRSKVTAERRLQTEVIGSELFKVLRSKYGEEYEDFMKKKLTAVNGTISVDGLGFDANLAEELASKVDVIVSSAATTAFDERYDIALNINTLGPRRLVDFAKRCPNLQLLLHVSTAFVNGRRKGRTGEIPFKMGDNIAKEMGESVPQLHVATELELVTETLCQIEREETLRLLENDVDFFTQTIRVDPGKRERKMKELGLERAKLFGWQDTYVFTKAMGEMLLDAERGRLPIVVMRPSVIESTLQEPFPGWMEGIRMMDPIVLAYGKGQMTAFLADHQGVLDVVPADMVVNAMLAAMAKRARLPGLSVYQVASSVVNPLILRELADVSQEHFTADPLLDKSGKEIKIKRLILIEDLNTFLLYMFILYQLPVQLSRLLPWRFLPRGRLAQKRIQVLIKVLDQINYLATIYKPYTFYLGRFDVDNIERLEKQLSTEELATFPFNIRSIDWSNYLNRVHMPGLRRYVLKGRGSRRRFDDDDQADRKADDEAKPVVSA